MTDAEKIELEQFIKDMDSVDAPDNIHNSIAEICTHFRSKINNENSILIKDNASGLSIIIMDTKEVPNIGRFGKAE